MRRDEIQFIVQFHPPMDYYIDRSVAAGVGCTLATIVVVVVCTASYSGTKYRNIFPTD